MVQVIENQDPWSNLASELGQLGGSYFGSQIRDSREDEKRKKLAQEQREAEKQRLSDVLQRYDELKNDPAYQNASLEEKMTLNGLLFGKDIGGFIGKAEELRLKEQEIQGKERDRKEKEKEAKPALTLNEELNQLHKRHGKRTEDLVRPFTKKDDFGNIFLDFEEDEKKRKVVLSRIDKEAKKLAKETERLYRQYGQPAPADIEEQLKSEISVDVNGMKVPLPVIESLEEFSQHNPPKKYKGKKAKDEFGYILESDGNQWNIIGFEGNQ